MPLMAYLAVDDPGRLTAEELTDLALASSPVRQTPTHIVTSPLGAVEERSEYDV